MKKKVYLGVQLFIMFLVILAGAEAQNGFGEYDLRKSVIKIFSSTQSYNYLQPWQKNSITSGSGSGFIIEGNRILTNAHVVEGSKYLQVKKFGDPKQYTAFVEIQGNDCDLAVIKVEDEKFFNDTKPFEIGELPKVMDEVIVVGYPIGGEELNITKGIVSRVEHITYYFSYFYFLGCQIDATINPGNSGGPVFSGDKVVGVAFQGRSSEDLSYMIPPPIIHHFLKDIEDGTYDGFSDLLVRYQEMINDDIRNHYSMPDTVSGVLVYDILPESPVMDKLEKGDIITKIDGVSIADDGSVEFRPGERTVWGYLTDRKYVDDEIEIEVYRDGSPMVINSVMTKLSDSKLVPLNKNDKEPKFYVVGGIVFQPLTVNYLSYFRTSNIPKKLENEWIYGKITEDKKEVVIISDVLPDDLNKGYQDIYWDFIVTKVNGKKIKQLNDLINIIEDTDEKFIVIEEKDGLKIVLNTDKLRSKNKEILEKYSVTKDRSDCYLD